MVNKWNYFEYCQRIALKITMANGAPYSANLAKYIRDYPYDPSIFPTRVIFEEGDRKEVEEFFKEIK